MDNDGVAERTGWVSADDAILVVDRDKNGRITRGEEISFVDDLPGAMTDLEGLGAYDSNTDGILDSRDNLFSTIQLWQDANQNGVSEADELSTLADRNIASINLTRNPTGESVNRSLGNVILNTSFFTRTDGSTGDVADAVFRYMASFNAPDKQEDAEYHIAKEPGSAVSFIAIDS